MKAKRTSPKLSIPMWARIPVLPGYNDSAKNVEASAKFMAEELGNCVKRGSLLPYHRLGETKLEILEVNYSVSTTAPSQEHLQEIQRVFEHFVLSAYIGG